MIKKWLQKIIKTIVTHRCEGCEKFCDFGLCARCLAKLPFSHNACITCLKPIGETQQCGPCLLGEPPYVQFIAACEYKPPISDHVMRLKFKHKLYSASILGQALTYSIKKRRQNLPMPQAIIPVPLSTKRLLYRGFNQSYEIAKVVSAIFNIPIITPMKKIKHTPQQSALTKNARTKNVRGAYELKEAILYTHVVILDDVTTTGSTISEVASVLKAKNIQVEVWCVAQA